MAVKSYKKCTQCENLIHRAKKHRKGRCAECWIDLLENTVNYTARQIIKNERGSVDRCKNDEPQSQWEWQYAIATQYAYNLLSMIGRKHEKDTTE